MRILKRAAATRAPRIDKEHGSLIKEHGSLIGEPTLWQLYRRVMGASLLEAHLAGSPPVWRKSGVSLALAAALTENLKEDDTLAVPARDLVVRYLCGAPLADLRQAVASTPPARHSAAQDGWAMAVDSTCGLLPGSGQEQASLAVGAALAARLHHGATLTVLLSRIRRAAAASETETPLGAWAQAALTATALQLPLLFITDSPAGFAPQYDDPRRPAPALPAIPVDRDDPLAIYRVVYESASRARTGGGPTWIDCRALPPPDKRRRHAAAAPAPLSPLASLEQVLRSRQFFAREQHRQMEHALQREFARAGWPVEDTC